MKQFFRSRRAWLWILAVVTIATIAIFISPAFGGLGIDSGLFDQQDCKSPCWHGLMPGTSTSEDVDDFLSALSQRQWPERSIRNHDTGCRSIRLVDKNRMGMVDLYEVDDGLTFIQSYHSNRLKLKEIVDFFGSPEYFEAVLYIGFDYYVYTIEVYYPRKGLAFVISPNQEKDIGWMGGDVIFGDLPDQEKVNGSVSGNLAVSEIHYFEPGDLSGYFQSKYLCSLEKADAITRGQHEIDNFIQEWSGFGKIDVIIDAELHRE